MAASDSAKRSSSHSENAAMKQLTVIATVFLPLTFVTGFFGQNFGWLVGHTDSWWDFAVFGIGGLLVPCVGLLAWFAAMASAGASGLAGAYLVITRAAADWVPLTQAVCRSVAGSACSPPVYRSMLYEIGVTALAIAVAIALLGALWRYCHRVQHARGQTRAHAEAAHVAGAQ